MTSPTKLRLGVPRPKVRVRHMTLSHVIVNFWLITDPGCSTPQSFLGLMSLQTGTELISLALLLNKVIGIYGLLAILTGYSLSALQLSMYIYSLLAVIALTYLIRHIRKQSPLENLALAWLYVADTIVNAGYTTAFAVTWYLATFHDPKGPAGAESDAAGGGVVPDEGQRAAGTRRCRHCQP